MKWWHKSFPSNTLKLCTVCLIFGTQSNVAAVQAASQLDHLDIKVPDIKVPTTLLSSSVESQTLLACATCGCSELCSVSLIDDSMRGKGGSTLTDSIWGNMILKIAYGRDQQLQKYRKKLRLGDNITTGSLFGIAGGTLAQTICSTATLNPPAGMTDSYAPGLIGLSLDVAANVTFGSRAFLNYKLKKEMRARQIFVKNQVEKILVHLENSETKCPDAQGDLSKIIGDRAAGECIQLWQSSHEVAQAEPLKVTQAELNQ